MPGDVDASVFEVVASGLGALGALMHEYFTRSHALGADASKQDLARLAELQHQLED
ncbi:MAG: hypothetical protein ACUVQI_09500 [Thermochromatium sp.]